MHDPESEFDARGPHPVGVVETRIIAPVIEASGDVPNESQGERVLPTEIWYPAAAGDPDRNDAPHPLGMPHRATPAAAPLDSPCPVVAFSHGNSGLRQQSTFLMTHLASWGFVVVAPDHVGNTFSEMLALPDEDARRETHLRMRAQRPHDVHAVIRALLDAGHLGEALPPLDPARLGLLGHSFGGWTAFKMPALESRVRAVCGLAPASEPFVGRKAFHEGELPLPEHARSLILAAEDDVLVDLETSVRPLSERLGEHSTLEIIDRADHFHFCDGIPLLHTMHENNPRENQPRPTRPLQELRDEADMHALLGERVTRFFADSLAAERRAG